MVNSQTAVSINQRTITLLQKVKLIKVNQSFNENIINVKHIISILLIGIFIQSCAKRTDTDTTFNLIEKVEKGLTTPVHIEGDSTWSIEDRMEHYGIPGVSVAVINNGKIEWAKGYGVIDNNSKSPVTEQTLFQASLLSMPVTSYGVLSLIEQDKISLDENINSYLKTWKLPDNEFTREKKATIRNLLNGTAGINLHAITGYSSDESVPTLVQVLNGTPPVNTDPILIIREIETELDISAGAYAIIQQMMIDVQGEKFPELMNELVLQPLGMNSSTFNQELSTEQSKIAATGYLRDGSMVKGKRHNYPVMAANGLWSTASDIAKFVINIQETLKGNSSKGLSKDMTESMLIPSGYKSKYWEDFKYGMGLTVLNKKEDIYFGHHGWNRGFFALMMAHRDKGYGVVVLTNTPYPNFNSEVIRSVALAYDWHNFVPTHKKIEIEKSFGDKVTGKFKVNNQTIEVFQKNNKIFSKNILDVNATELIKVSDSIFVRRNSHKPIQFKQNAENGEFNLLFLNRDDETISSTFIKLENDKKEPVEFLLEGNFEKALKAYRMLFENDSNHSTVTENYLNDLGFRFYNEDRMALSKNTFKVNMMLYPDNFKVYESFAKACVKTGEIDLAILNYSKSLELNPQNENARDMLKELQKGE